MSPSSSYTAFIGLRCAGSGSIEEVSRALAGAPTDALPLIFDDLTGAPVELDLRHGPQAAVEEYRRRTSTPGAEPPPRPGRGRPRLGVTPREVTLMPQHWEWLATQPGGASATLRRLVDEARRSSVDVDRIRQARDAAYRAMSALAGDLPGFEAASRALFRADKAGFDAALSQWPPDVAGYVARLAKEALGGVA